MQTKGVPRLVFSMNFEQSFRYGSLSTGAVAMLEGRWKYVHYLGRLNYPMMPKLEDALYDLDSDPKEDINLIAIHQDIAGKMLREIETQLRLHGGPVN